MMRRLVIVALAAASLCACRPASQDHSSGGVPPADAPASSRPVATVATLQERLARAAFDLTGDGPAWTLKIRPDSLALVRPGQLDVIAVNPGPQMQGSAAAWDVPSAGNGGLLIVTLTPGACAIAGSAATYPYHAAVEADGERLIGCGAEAGVR
jgi:uncharacterized membrane protein